MLNEKFAKGTLFISQNYTKFNKLTCFVAVERITYIFFIL